MKVIRTGYALDPNRDCTSDSIALAGQLLEIVRGHELGVGLYGLVDALACVIAGNVAGSDDLLRIAKEHLDRAVAQLQDIGPETRGAA